MDTLERHGQPGGAAAPLMEHPLVSVIIPTFGRSELLRRAITSVVTQSYERWELLVIDDNDPGTAARRETAATVLPFLADPRVTYSRQGRNAGLSASRNLGIRLSSGELVSFLDDDDEWLPGKLELQVACFAQGNHRLGVVYGGWNVVDSETGESDIQRPRLRGKVLSALGMNVIGPPSTVMCRREALVEIGAFDERLSSRSDVDLYLRLARSYLFDYVSEPVVNYYLHAGGNMSRDARGTLQEFEYFFQKHRDHLTASASRHSTYLERQGELLLQAGEIREARVKFRKAIQIAGPRGVLVAKYLLACAGIRAYARARKLITALKRRQRPGEVHTG